MKLFYIVGIHLYFIALFIAQIFNSKAKKWIVGRKDVFKNLPIEKFEGKFIVWFHCASLGEFDQAIPLINEFKKNKNVFVLLSFFSPSGFEHYKKRNVEIDFATYIPLDTKRNAKKWNEIVKPKITFFIKYEFWFFHIEEALKYGKVYSICSLFRENQVYFKWYGSFFRDKLKLISDFFVQNEISKILLNKIGINNVIVVGDMRYDRVIEHKENSNRNKIVDEFTNGEKIFILGSSWIKDELFLKKEINLLLPNKKVIIAPHDISEKHIKFIENLFYENCVRYSNWHENSNKKILIIDCIGILNSLYQYADVAYVGGGFTGKLHNILEPAVYGMGILIGPKYSKFPEAQELINRNIVFSIHNINEVKEKLNYAINNYEIISLNAKEFIESQKGVALKIMSKISF